MLRLLILGITAATPAFSQQACPALPAARQAIERGWSAYRANDMTNAGNEFKRALTLCPSELGALTGAGYVAMRQGRLPAAKSFFARAIAVDSGSYDAVVGAGMVAYRQGDPAGARRSFERALRILPGDSTALSYLARIPGQVSADVLASRTRPGTTTVTARAGRRVIEVKNRTGQWSPMWIKAVNLGAALPGKFPSEFPPNDSTYERWIALIAEMGANTLRDYTVHPPHNYAA